MTHFRECIETICKTTGLKKKEVAEHLGITHIMMGNYMRKGLSPKLSPMYIHRLRELVHVKKDNPCSDRYIEREVKKRKVV